LKRITQIEFLNEDKKIREGLEAIYDYCMFTSFKDFLET